VTKIKICGLSDIQHALAAVEAGADFLGLVFAPSQRQVSTKKAMSIVKEVHTLSPHPVVVGVFTNSTPDEVNRTADYCNLDWIQLSGEETWDYCQQIERPIIKTVHVSSAKTAEEIVSEIATGHRLLPRHDFVCLLDSKVGYAYGGTGQAFDWKLAREVSAKFSVIIAGGLTPANVSQLVKKVRPWGVDVSTGVERNGRKDTEKIKEFIQTVRTASG
jgi:phosphoribosylanthranilate isomerase